MVGTALAAFCTGALAAESLSERAGEVAPKLEVLDELGGNCLAEIRRHGMEGADAEGCRAFVARTRELGPGIDRECDELDDLARAKRQFAAANPDYIKAHPLDTVALVKELDAYNKVCERDVVAVEYPNIKEAMGYIRAIRKQSAQAAGG